jgi:hypothetical protein
MAVPPPPVQMQAPETTTAGLADTYPPSPLGDEDRWDAPTPGTDPLRQDPLGTAAPLRDDPFDGGRR